jgi:hypothetical protein
MRQPDVLERARAVAEFEDGTAGPVVSLSVRVPGHPTASRQAEPVTLGLPLPMGLVADERCLTLAGAGGNVPLQASVLERWPDGSIRWVLLDFQADAPRTYHLRLARPGVGTSGLNVRDCHGAAEIASSTAVFRVSGLGPFRLDVCSLDADIPTHRVALEIRGQSDTLMQPEVSSVEWETIGPLRSVLLVRASVALEASRSLQLALRLHFYAGSPTVRFDVAVTNPAPARHVDGFWELGDAGSVLLRDLTVRVETGPPQQAMYSTEPGGPLQATTLPFELYQDSSGGEHWNSRVHVNRDGIVPLSFCGYRVRAGAVTGGGSRATPVLWTDDGAHRTGIAVRHFWQNAPKSLEATGSHLRLRLFPRQFADLHEIQGGERKTHTFHVAFGTDTVSSVPLDWVRQPAFVAASAEHYCAAGAVPYLLPQPEAPRDEYEQLITSIVEGPHSFTQRREEIDEYGWRSFGDIYADHESAYYSGPRPIVSHYNNQYDAIAGFAHQFLRSADPRWWSSMDELASHVRDIDIYHTDDDKAAYAGGLFWHTAHYVDAGRSTHRCYPKAPGVPGGGPANEHAYSTGLMLHYFLTGDVASRDAALGLADWVIRMDDGNRTPLRWLAGGATGLASKTHSLDYHGPGRGAGNAIVVLLNGYRLSGRPEYLTQAEALIRRCVHPCDDVGSRGLLDPESRWSYTVFFQSLGRYLDEKILRNDLDATYAYARDSLLLYARWMHEHEYLYLEKPELLEYPTETWAAQDVRKSDVLLFAAKHATAAADRDGFIARADALFDGAMTMLAARPTKFTARPRVILMGSGFMRYAFRPGRVFPRAPAGPSHVAGPGPADFVPQRTIAKRRLKGWAVAVAMTGTALAGLVATSL